MFRICTICCRGGSKGVSGKNIRPLMGKPLIAHSILQAKASKLFDAVAVTSDSSEILRIAAEYNADFMVERPAEMASDFAAKTPAIVHCVRHVEERSNLRFDTVVDLDATSPLRSIDDIIQAVDLLESSGSSNVLTATPARRSPYFNLIERNEKGYVVISKSPSTPIFRRQDSPECFDMNASIYVWQKQALFAEPKIFFPDTLLFVMPPERSIDIDSEFDFKLVEYLAEYQSHN